MKCYVTDISLRQSRSALMNKLTQTTISPLVSFSFSDEKWKGLTPPPRLYLRLSTPPSLTQQTTLLAFEF